MAKLLNYAHPVLGNGDDFTIDWEIETFDERVQPLMTGGAAITRILVDCIATGEEAIDALVNGGMAALFLEIRCLNTCFRKWFPLTITDDHSHVDIPSECLMGTVSLILTLEATGSVDGYMPVAISDVYPENQVFKLNKGDILAKHEAEFSAGEIYLDRNLTAVSWIRYRLSQEDWDEPRIDYGGSDVVIDLPDVHHRFVTEGAGKVDGLIRSMYIAPVLAQCIEKVRHVERQDSDDEISGCDWVESLKIQLSIFDFDEDDDPVSMAWMILGGSLKSAIEEINSYMEDE